MLIPHRAPCRSIHDSSSSSILSMQLPSGESIACGLSLSMLGFDLTSEVDELTFQLWVDVTLLGQGSTGKGEGATRRWVEPFTQVVMRH